MSFTLREQKEQTLFQELDKGIDDMEQGRILSHDETMQILRERISTYTIQDL